MAAPRLKVAVISPGQTLFEGDADMVVAPAWDGEGTVGTINAAVETWWKNKFKDWGTDTGATLSIVRCTQYRYYTYGSEDGHIHQLKMVLEPDALVRITTTTICGTDVHILKGEYPVAPGLTVGHEPVGVVEEVGAAVTGPARRG